MDAIMALAKKYDLFVIEDAAQAIDGYYKQFHHKIKVIPQGFNFEEFSVTDEIYIKNTELYHIFIMN